jgi:predicted type IV restriction endonuclease
MVDLVEIANLSQRREFATNEENTKSFLIEPFFKILGYDVHNPKHVANEETTDDGGRIDYLFNTDSGKIAVEAEEVGKKLNSSAHGIHQAKQYLNSHPDYKMAIATDGITYLFFSDFEQQDYADTNPFKSIDITSLTDEDVVFLQNVTRDKFDIDRLKIDFKSSKQIEQVAKLISDNLEYPSDDFVNYLIKNSIDKKPKKSKNEEYRDIVVAAIERVNGLPENSQIEGVADQNQEPFSFSIITGVNPTDAYRNFFKKYLDKLKKITLTNENASGSIDKLLGSKPAKDPKNSEQLDDLFLFTHGDTSTKMSRVKRLAEKLNIKVDLQW